MHPVGITTPQAVHTVWLLCGHAGLTLKVQSTQWPHPPTDHQGDPPVMHQ